MTIIVSVKYQGPTNHRGSRWTATMSDNRGGKLRATAPYDYVAEEAGREEAVERVLAKWVANTGISTNNFTITCCGEDHRGESIYRCVSF